MDKAAAPAQAAEPGRVVSPFSLTGAQPKVKVGAPADSAEHEANRVADQVSSGSSAKPAISRLQLMQRKPAESEPEAQKKEEAPAPAPAAETVAKMEESKPAPVQRSTGESKPEDASVHRAEAHDTSGDPQAQRCCCEAEPAVERPSGTASVYCKPLHGQESPSENELNHSVRRKAQPDSKASADMDAAATHAVATRDAGAPLRPYLLQKLESRMGVDLSGVRVHEGSSAHASAAALQARAFTHKGDIWLGKGESQDNLNLMAHEATHVVQQGAAVRRSTDAPKHREPEEDGKPVVRRSVWDKVTGVAGAVWDATGGKVVDAAGNVLSMGADLFWTLVRKVAPDWVVDFIQQIRQKGLFGYLKDKLIGAFHSIFDGLSSGEGFIPTLIQTFGNLMGTAREVIAALAHGDCKPLFAAVSHLGDVLSKMAGDAWDKIKAFFAPVGDFFSGLWKKFGAPVVDFLGEVAADVWNEIKALGQKLWDGTQPVRDAAAAAWKWVKDELGIGDGPDGQNGLLQWVETKLGEAWDWCKAQLQPVIGPMKALVDKINAILPLEAILNLRKTVHEWLQHATQMATSMRDPKGVTKDREDLRARILPAVKAAIVSLRGRIVSAGTWVSGQIGGIAQTVTGFFASLRSNSILGKLSGAIQWVQDRISSLTNWVQSGVMSLFTTIGNGVAKLADFVEPVLNVLKKVVSVIANVVKELPGLVMGPFWMALPACIKDPIKNFIIENILSAIPIISTFVKLPEIWSKIQNLVLDFLAQVFVKGDLSGAAVMVIRFVLEAAGVNVDLFLSVLAKAAGSLDEIIMHPVKFLTNLAGAVGKGVKQFLGNIGRHLATGLVNWLVAPLKDLGVEPIKDLSLNSLLGLALGVLGINEAKLRAKAEKAVGPKAVAVLEAAWKWIKALITGGIGGLWDEIKGQLTDLYGMVIGGITQWITTEIVEAGLAKLVDAVPVVGEIIEAIQTIYKAVTFLVNKINEILALVDAVLNSIQDIASGKIGTAANWIEQALARTVPLVIAFLAKWLGIGDPAPKVREIVVKVQTRVEAALDWLVDKAIAIGKKIAGFAKSVVGLFFPTEHFKAGDEEHTITAIPRGGDYDIVIRSETRGVEEFVSFARAEAKKNSVPEVENQVEDLHNKYLTWKGITVVQDASGKDDEKSKKDKEGKYVEIALLVETIWQKVAKDGPVPDSVIHWQPQDSKGRARGVVADPLTTKGDEGGPPQDSIPGWADETPGNRSPLGRIRAHLLHYALHGPGKAYNLTPTSNSVNALMYTRVEQPTLEALGIRPKLAAGQVPKAKQLRYTTTVTYDDSQPEPMASFAKHVEMEAVDKEGTQAKIGSLSVDNY